MNFSEFSYKITTQSPYPEKVEIDPDIVVIELWKTREQDRFKGLGVNYVDFKAYAFPKRNFHEDEKFWEKEQNYNFAIAQLLENTNNYVSYIEAYPYISLDAKLGNVYVHTKEVWEGKHIATALSCFMLKRLVSIGYNGLYVSPSSWTTGRIEIEIPTMNKKVILSSGTHRRLCTFAKLVGVENVYLLTAQYSHSIAGYQIVWNPISHEPLPRPGYLLNAKTGNILDAETGNIVPLLLEQKSAKSNIPGTW